MERRCQRAAFGLVLALVCLSADARAAGWADSLFSEHRHDFGTVPRGGKVRHDFVVTNHLPEAVTILDVRASCGCTTGRAGRTPIAPSQSAIVEAEMDTRNFVGAKATTLYVTMVTASGRQGEARLGVSSMILSDVVLNPGSIEFGTVTRGQAPTLTLTLDRVGNPYWRVERMLSASRVLSASLTETARNGASVSYSLAVTLKPDAPAGLVRDEIRLVTNDPETPTIPIPINALIRGDLSARPSVLYLGRTTSSAAIHGQVMVMSSRPFTIATVTGDSEGIHVGQFDNTPKTVQVLPIFFRPEETTARGDIRRILRITTNLPGEEAVEVTALVHVDP